jgi:hypothetical protein
MYKLALAFTTLALAAGIASARADSSGHMRMNDLDSELPWSNDPMAPMTDGLPTPNRTVCSYGRGGIEFGGVLRRPQGTEFVRSYSSARMKCVVGPSVHWHSSLEVCGC